MIFFDWLAIVSFPPKRRLPDRLSQSSRLFSVRSLRLTYYFFLLDKSVGGCGYVEDHQHPAEFMHENNLGTGKMAPSVAQSVI